MTTPGAGPPSSAARTERRTGPARGSLASALIGEGSRGSIAGCPFGVDDRSLSVDGELADNLPGARRCGRRRRRGGERWRRCRGGLPLFPGRSSDRRGGTRRARGEGGRRRWLLLRLDLRFCLGDEKVSGDRLGRGLRRRPGAEQERHRDEQREHRRHRGAGPAQVDPEQHAEGTARRRLLADLAEYARGEVSGRRNRFGTPICGEGGLERGHRRPAFGARQSVRVERGAIRGGDLAVMEKREKLARPPGMHGVAHGRRPSSRGTRISFSCPRPRAIRDLTVPTGRDREAAISS